MDPSVPAARMTVLAETLAGVAVVILALEVDPPAALRRLGDVADLGVREDVGAVAHRVGQVGERHRVLGADVASPAAVAAARAGGLRDAGRVEAGLEADDDGCRDRRLVECDARLVQRLVLGAARRRRIARRPHPPLRPRVTLAQQAVVADLVGPHRIGEHARIGAQGHAGIDERSAAEPTADQHVHVVPETYVVEAGRRSEPVAPAGDLHLGAQVGEAGRELAGDVLPPPLEHGNPQAGPRQPRGRHAAAVARAHHHHVVVRLEAIEGACETGHGAPS